MLLFYTVGHNSSRLQVCHSCGFQNISDLHHHYRQNQSLASGAVSKFDVDIDGPAFQTEKSDTLDPAKNEMKFASKRN